MRTKAAREAWRTIFDLLIRGEAHNRFTEAAAALGVSPGVLKGLFHIEPGQGIPMRDLADHWRCDASYVTSVTDMLEERGMARRWPHPTDRRVKMIVLTEAGVAARERAFDLLYDPPAAFGALTGAEQRQLRDLLAKVAAADDRVSSSRAASSA
ncbi:MAG TPA: MarR family winged helix-turn-helix transcriptional regulator [Actinomycetota bacterium]|nr:MarR family winged helix-turn-helix transcriptional regulator [Actinomycetota bacterium]